MRTEFTSIALNELGIFVRNEVEDSHGFRSPDLNGGETAEVVAEL